jgi:hypothetical protein
VWDDAACWCVLHRRDAMLLLPSSVPCGRSAVAPVDANRCQTMATVTKRPVLQPETMLLAVCCPSLAAAVKDLSAMCNCWCRQTSPTMSLLHPGTPIDASDRLMRAGTMLLAAARSSRQYPRALLSPGTMLLQVSPAAELPAKQAKDVCRHSY